MSVLVIDLFKLFTPNTMLAGFVGNLSISSMSSNLLAYNCSQNSLMIFVSLCHWLLFLLSFTSLGPLPFLLGKPH